MFTEFAHTQEMQMIHIINSYITNTLNMYLIANLMLMVFDEKISIKRKFAFAFITGSLFLTTFVCVVYLIGGAVSFSPMTYILLVSPNPIFALLYCVIGIKILKLPSIRSIKIIGYLYLFYLLIMNFNLMISPIFFSQTADRYNYALAMCKQTVFFLSVLFAYIILRHQIKTKKYLIRFADKVFINIKKELFLFFLTTSFYYLLDVTLPSLIANRILACFLILLILSLFLVLNIYIDISAFQKADIENKEIHINALLKGANEFSGVKHDFYNILQTYGGYIEIGDLKNLERYHSSLLRVTSHAGNLVELSQRMPENPALVSLLINKSEVANRKQIRMSVFLQCNINDLYLDNFDTCRCITCLLDNAIEAASISIQKKIFFTIQNKMEDTKLIIISNSTSTAVDVNEIIARGFTSKQGHTGLGLSNVYKIIDTYGNCTFQIAYYNYEFSAYMEIKKK